MKFVPEPNVQGDNAAPCTQSLVPALDPDATKFIAETVPEALTLPVLLFPGALAPVMRVGPLSWY